MAGRTCTCTAAHDDEAPLARGDGAAVSAPTPIDYAGWRATRLGRITEAVEREAILEICGPLRGASVLDVGCGEGAYALELARRGARATGIDLSRAALARAVVNAHAANLPVAFAAGDAQRLPFAGARFDLVVSVTSLCFVTSPADAVQEMGRVLRGGGRLVIGELGLMSAWAGWRRLRGWLGSATWRGARFWTAAGLSRLVAGAGFTPGPIRGAAFHPPSGLAAALPRPADPWLGRATTLGAAFIAIEATKRR